MVGARKSVVAYPWSSLSEAYDRPVADRPSWSAVVQGLNGVGLKDNVAGHREFIERLDLRARQEVDPGFIPLPPEADARTSHLRRGWCWGSQEFTGRTLKKIEERGGGINAIRRTGRARLTTPIIWRVLKKLSPWVCVLRVVAFRSWCVAGI